ncbi:hypothetical protein G9A89_016543 [Geosiphon pyriformis]|nr:hypothetical protein G9A89_016543 [Geosiphon pyriformis]
MLSALDGNLLNRDVDTLTSFDVDRTLQEENENVVSKLFQRVKISFNLTTNSEQTTSPQPGPSATILNSRVEPSEVVSQSSPPETPNVKSSRPPSIFLPDKEKKGFFHGGVAPAPPVVFLNPAFGYSPQLMIESNITTQDTHSFLNDEANGYVKSKNVNPSTSSMPILFDISTPNTLQSYNDGSNPSSVQSFQAASSRGNTNSLKQVMRRLRGEGISRLYWMADDICQECFDCKATFTTFRRKHHCRFCGQIFCAKCAQHSIAGEKYRHKGPMRVCNFCNNLIQEYGDESESDLEQAFNQTHEFATSRQIPANSLIQGNNYFRTPTSTVDQSYSLSPPVSYVPQHWSPRAPSPDTLSINDGFKKIISAGSSLFVTRSRSNTVSEEQTNMLSSSPAPFRKCLTEEDKTTPVVNPAAVLDPEIAPFMNEEDQEDPFDSWSNPSNGLNFLSTTHPNVEGGESATQTPAASEYAGSDDDTWDFSMKTHSKLIPKNTRNDELRNHFGKERTVNSRRRSINANRPPRTGKRGLIRQINTSLGPSVEIPINGSPIERPSSPFHPRHHRSSSQPMRIEINPGFLVHMKRLLRQALQEAEIDLSEGWEDVIMKLMLKVSENLNPDIRNGDEIDIRHYVKIKKIPGGTPQDSQYITGVVCTKKLAHKKMARVLPSPRVLILTFPLELQRVENQFMSLDPVIAQEDMYLQNLVARIVDLRPHLVLVEKTVARNALQFLLDAKLTVALNVKPSVIEAVARCTRADILPSLEKFGLNPKLGKCGEFYVKTFEHELIPGRRKSYLFFENCPREMGCTIVLRGGDISSLEKIKQITDLMVFVVYNLKLESALLNNQSARASSHLMDDMLDHKLKRVSSDFLTSDLNLNKWSEALLPYESKILSASPFIKFPPPYLLVKLMQKQTERKKAELFLEKARVGSENLSVNHADIDDIGDSQPSTLCTAEQVIAVGELEDIDNELEQLFRTWENYLLMSSDVSPFAHQNIVVLYSNVCTVTQAPCQGPEVHIIEYYSESDRTLGQYLEEMCYDSNYLCPAKTCDRPLLMHYKSYCHGYARISVVIEQFDCPRPAMENKILMWSYCTKCKKSTQMLPMSEDTWKYSFGKYLEQSFYQTELKSRVEGCPHAIYRDHKHYFGLKNLAVRFEYQPIDLMEVSVPPMVLHTKPEVTIRLKNLDYEMNISKIKKYWDSVNERIINFDYGLVQPEKQEASRLELREMSNKVVEELKATLQQLQKAYMDSLPTDTLALNSVLVVLQEKVLQWDRDFNDIARNYFQPRFITRQFKRIFDPPSVIRPPSGSPVKELSWNSFKLDQVVASTLKLDEIFSEKSSHKPVYTPTNEKPPQIEGKGEIQSNAPETVIDKENGQTTKSELIESSPLLALELRDNLPHDLSIDPKNSSVHPSKILVFDSKAKPNSRSLQRVASQQTQSTILKGQDSSTLIHTKEPENMNLYIAPSKRKPVSTKSIDIPITKEDIPDPELLHITNNDDSFPPGQNTPAVSASNPRISGLARVLEKEKAKEEKLLDKPSIKGKRIKKETESSDSLSTSRQNAKLGRIENKSLSPDFRRPSARTFDKYDSKFSTINKLRRGKPIKLVSKPTIEVFSNVKEATKEESEDEDQDEDENDERNAKGLPIPMNKPETYHETDRKQEYPLLTHEPSEETFPYDVEDQLGSISSTFSTNRESLNEKDILESDRRLPIVKSLTNFLADRNLKFLEYPSEYPLEYPLHSTEHVFPDSFIIVREDEPSSIISFTLSSKDYLKKLVHMQQSTTVTEVFVPEAEGYPGTNGSNWDMVDMDEGPENIKDALLRETGSHMKYQFSEGSTQLFCKIFFAEQFDALRRNCGCESTYIESLARCVKWDSTGGKSGSAFLKTRDDRLVMKQMSRLEMDAFLKFAPAYFEYMSKAFFHELPTVLAKIFGFYRIGYKTEQSGKSMKIDVIVMENLFYERKISKIFDLKGSMRNRHVRSTGKENEVLLDENLLELLHDKPLFLREHSKRILRASLWNDTLFLAKLNVMDYSLLVGIDDERQELVVGIVDFIRTFTWDKKLESWVKETGFLGGGGKEPTIVSPRQYKHRFREAMDRYFLMSRQVSLVIFGSSQNLVQPNRCDC